MGCVYSKYVKLEEGKEERKNEIKEERNLPSYYYNAKEFIKIIQANKGNLKFLQEFIKNYDGRFIKLTDLKFEVMPSEQNYDSDGLECFKILYKICNKDFKIMDMDRVYKIFIDLFNYKKNDDDYNFVIEFLNKHVDKQEFGKYLINLKKVDNEVLKFILRGMYNVDLINIIKGFDGLINSYTNNDNINTLIQCIIDKKALNSDLVDKLLIFYINSFSDCSIFYNIETRNKYKECCREFINKLLKSKKTLDWMYYKHCDPEPMKNEIYYMNIFNEILKSKKDEPAFISNALEKESVYFNVYTACEFQDNKETLEVIVNHIKNNYNIKDLYLEMISMSNINMFKFLSDNIEELKLEDVQKIIDNETYVDKTFFHLLLEKYPNVCLKKFINKNLHNKEYESFIKEYTIKQIYKGLMDNVPIANVIEKV